MISLLVRGRLRIALPLRAVVAVALLLAPASPAMSDTAQNLAAARARLQELERQLTADREQESALAQQLSVLRGYVVQGQAAFQELSARLRQSRNAEATAQQRYQQLHEQMQVVVRNAYIEGSGSAIAALFDSSSETEFGERLDVLAQISRGNSLLASEASAMASDYGLQRQQTQTILAQQQAALSNLQSEEAQMTSQTAALQAARARLQKTRDNVLSIVVRYRTQLGTTDLARLIDTLQGKDNASYGDWARAFLGTLSAPECKENLIVTVSWELNEGTDAKWNPLATTYDMPGASTFNYAGVKNYASLQDGLQATKQTLLKGSSSYGYMPIVRDLRGCAAAERTASAIAASSWCGCGSGYVTSLIDRVRENYNTYARL